jgi:hypothetical protein
MTPIPDELRLSVQLFSNDPIKAAEAWKELHPGHPWPVRPDWIIEIILAEREACAVTAELYQDFEFWPVPQIAAAIRARNTTETET